MDTTGPRVDGVVACSPMSGNGPPITDCQTIEGGDKYIGNNTHIVVCADITVPESAILAPSMHLEDLDSGSHLRLGQGNAKY